MNMKHLNQQTVIYILLVFFSTFYISSAQAKPPAGYYYLICKSNGNENISIEPTATRNLEVGISFRRSTKGYKQAPSALRPGECTFVDRPLSSKEPDNAVLSFAQQKKVSIDPAGFLIPGRRIRNVQHFPVSLRVNRTNRGLTINFLQGQPSSRGSRKQAFAKIMMETGKLYTLTVKNEGGRFRIKRYYPGALTGDTIDPRGKAIIKK